MLSVFVASLLLAAPAFDHSSQPFRGLKVNGGTVLHTLKDGKHQLTLSDDFQVPDSPAPHWQIVDSRGNVHLLQRLVVKEDKLNKTITPPCYVLDVDRVQIWCAFAQTLLGETSFDQVLALNPMETECLAKSTPFAGVKANKGIVSLERSGSRSLLTLSEDFVVPDTPAPHWQLVDSKGNAYLLQRLVIKGDRFHGTIEIPSYVPDVAKVQIWCAWAETLLGEASFSQPVM